MNHSGCPVLAIFGYSISEIVARTPIWEANIPVFLYGLINHFLTSEIVVGNKDKSSRALVQDPDLFFGENITECGNSIEHKSVKYSLRYDERSIYMSMYLVQVEEDLISV